MRPEEVTAALFDGAIMAFRDLSAVARLGTQVRAIVSAAFDTGDPCAAEEKLSPDAFRDASLRARRIVAADPEVHDAWRATLGQIGFRAGDMLGDRMRLRIVPSRASAHRKSTRPLPPHRDSWASGLMAQVNWWMPLYPLAPSRTMVVWPEAFCRFIPNNSSRWTFDALRADRTGTYPLLPAADHPVGVAGRPVLTEPDTLIAFSAAHLHASATDNSGRSRISIDTRSLWRPDLDAARGAPNVDAPNVAPQWAWFSEVGARRY